MENTVNGLWKGKSFAGENSETEYLYEKVILSGHAIFNLFHLSGTSPC